MRGRGDRISKRETFCCISHTNRRRRDSQWAHLNPRYRFPSLPQPSATSTKAIASLPPRWREASKCCAASRRSSRCSATRRSRRSEEHTSELQSRLHLVCRLLLEKKKKKVF